MDTSASDHSFEGNPPKDYWFGRKCLECVMAQNIVQNSRLYESVAQVDVSMPCGRGYWLILLVVTTGEKDPGFPLRPKLDRAPS